MRARQLGLQGAVELTPVQHGDARGLFLEWYREDVVVAAVGRRLPLAQANCSVSRAGTLRGIHFADVPPGQAKYVTCTQGSFLDIVVDLRVGSPTFGRWESVVLDTTDRRAVFIAEGLGHAAMSLADGSTLLYLCSAPYAPAREHGVHPLDPRLGIPWPVTAADGSALEPVLSAKDAAAPGLLEARENGLLPSHADCEEHYLRS